jgi:hypothetical protein
MRVGTQSRSKVLLFNSGPGNSILWSNYPADVRDWIARHGGLGTQIIDLRGSELAAMFSRCR